MTGARGASRRNGRRWRAKVLCIGWFLALRAAVWLHRFPFHWSRSAPPLGERPDALGHVQAHGHPVPVVGPAHQLVAGA